MKKQLSSTNSAAARPLQVRRKQKELCCGCVLVRYPEQDTYTALQEELKRNEPQDQRDAFASLHHQVTLVAHFGTSDRFATMWGLPLSVGVIVYSQIVLGWGVYDVLHGYGGVDHYWDWDMVGQFSFGLFKVAFGSFGTFGVLLRRLSLLYLTSVCFKVFLLSLSVELLVKWATAILLWTGLGFTEDPFDYTQLVRVTCYNLIILIAAAITHYGMFRSISAVIVTGGSGFERKSWAQLMLERQESLSAIFPSIAENTVDLEDPTIEDCFDVTARRQPTVQDFF